MTAGSVPVYCMYGTPGASSGSSLSTFSGQPPPSRCVIFFCRSNSCSALAHRPAWLVLVQTHRPARRPGPRGSGPPVLCRCSVPGRSMVISSLPSGLTRPPTCEGLARVRAARTRSRIRQAMRFMEDLISNVAAGPVDGGALEQNLFLVEGGAAADAPHQDHHELGAVLVGHVQGIRVGAVGVEVAAGVVVADVDAAVHQHD